jgi:CBS domain-containing protein/anti-sigma regulatory factor (Ser/Thr protein kinase)
LTEATDPLAGQAEITRTHELVYELSIEQVMNREVLTLRPDQSLQDAKELFRVNRISGAPVVKDGALVGIVSIEDIIVALERNQIHLPVADRMTSRVVTVRPDESVVRAVNKFSQLKLGRMPVVDSSGQLVGIITRSDIVRGLLKAIDVNFRQEEAAHHRASHVFEDIVSDRTSVTIRYAISNPDISQGGAASSQIQRALGRLGVDPRAARRAAIVCYEAEMNIIIHARGSGELMMEVQPHQIAIQASDDGPGMADVELALQPGYSTAPDWIRELGFGAGMGLNNIKSSADRFRIETAVDKGTRLFVTILLERRK